MRNRFAAALLAASCLEWAFSAAAGPLPVVINEIYYDHPGADAGYEFVELFNASDSLVSLAGFRLQAGDGAGPGRWRALWEGAAGDALPGHARLVIGEAQVSPAPDRLQSLALENGPDAVRLLSPDGHADVVGYGALTYAEYFEGSPAPDVAAGFSLARASDGADLGDNAADFVALSPPTPGASNRPERDVALVAASRWLEPERISPGESVVARARVVNRGTAPLAAGDVRLRLWCARAPSLPPEPGDPAAPLSTSDSLAYEAPLADGLEPGDTAEVSVRWTPPGEGAYRLALAARVEEDGVIANDRLEGWLRVGDGPLVLSEVMYAPRPGEPEWAEVRVRDARAVDLTRFRLQDASGRAGQIDERLIAWLEPDSMAVVTADAGALLAAHPSLSPSRVFSLAPWPVLNNTAGGATAADRVTLRDDRGVVSDDIAYPGGAPAGYSWERRDGEEGGDDPSQWGIGALPGGTPLAANSLSALPGAGHLSLSAPVWRAGAGGPGLRVAFRLAWDRAVVRISVRDVRGREWARLADGPSPAAAEIVWDGRGRGGALPPGAYFVALDAQPAQGGERLRLAEPIVLAP